MLGEPKVAHSNTHLPNFDTVKWKNAKIVATSWLDKGLLCEAVSPERYSSLPKYPKNAVLRGKGVGKVEVEEERER